MFFAMTQHHGTIFRGSLLVAGTTIGGGMLALPVATAEMGFFPSLCLYFLCWLFMASTGLLLLEACLWLKDDTNIVSMAGHTLGKAGSAFAWGWYLFLFYCLALAYVVGGSNFVKEATGNVLSDRTSAIIFVVVFGAMVVAGERLVGRLNVIFMGGLALAYFGFVVLGLDHVKGDLLTRNDWSYSLSALPIVFVAFAYQGLVPTLTRYMDYDAKRTRAAILIGSFIPFITYIIWQGLIQGIVPLEGVNGLAQARAEGQTAIPSLKHFIQTPYVYHLGQFFAFFALSTSFLGVTLGLFDFLADGLSIKKTGMGKVILSALVFIPPLLLAELYPDVFLAALDLAGGFGVALLLGLLPIIMVWVGRYRKHLNGAQLLPGGRWVLGVLFIFVVLEVIIETYHTISRLST
ncbi:MAG: aromatic amino acid transport family protein [Chlamydiales bacterium]|nr:aromatic amino acid transport family protein [Chlamydiales bacterium]